MNQWDYLGEKPGDSFETPNEAIRDAVKFVKKEATNSIATGWGEFRKVIENKGQTQLHHEKMTVAYLKKIKGVYTDVGVYLTQKDNIGIVIMGREKGAFVYCYNGGDAGMKYSYGFTEGSMPTAKEVAGGTYGRVDAPGESGATAGERVSSYIRTNKYAKKGHSNPTLVALVHSHIIDKYHAATKGLRPNKREPGGV